MAKRIKTAIVQVKVRARESLRAKLETGAKRRGVSLNAEIIDRLEHSFQKQDLLSEILELSYGSELAGVLMALGHTMKEAGTCANYESTGSFQDFLGSSNWLENPHAFNEAAKSASAIIEAFRPANEIVVPKIHRENLGQELAAFNLTTIADPEKAGAPSNVRWGRKVSDLLGPLAEKLS